ncbi:RNA polymerase sigma factor [Qipengyuania sp. GH1]|nr:RNA polymerase sigma factor [Qipengyuania aestuarii]
MHEPDEGLQAVFLANRQALLRFLEARGARGDAEDVLHEVWLKLERSAPGPVASPMSYLYRIANTVMIDRFRSARQAQLREAAWSEATGDPEGGVSEAPSAERLVIGRQMALQVDAALADLPERAREIFQRSRIAGQPQREIARDMRISVSTVESDLRKVYLVLAQLKERFDEE